MDSYSYTAPARVKSLVVPVGEISSLEVSRCIEALHIAREVRLVDLSPVQGHFNPQGFPHGRVVHEFTSRNADSEEIFLHDLEPFRKTFCVIGICHYDDNMEQYLDKIKQQHTRQICHFLLAVNVPDGVSSSRASPIMLDSNMETNVCDITSQFLESLSKYADSFQHITIRSPGSLSNNTLARSQSVLRTASLVKQKKRLSSASFGVSEEKQRIKRLKGRHLKMMGNFYLMAGRLNDALKYLCDAILTLRSCNDYLWIGSAMDLLGVCLVMLGFLEIPFSLPSALHHMISVSEQSGLISPTGSPRPSTQTAIAQTLSYELVEKIFEKSMQYYRLSTDSMEDYVPQLVYCEAILRYVKLMAVSGNGLDREALHCLVNDQLPKGVGNANTAEIVVQCKEILSSKFQTLDFKHQCRILSCLISVYDFLGLYRRRSLLLKMLVDLVTPKLKSETPESLKDDEKADLLVKDVLRIYRVGDCDNPWILLHKSVINTFLALCQKLNKQNCVVDLCSVLLRHYRISLNTQEQLNALDLIRSNSKRCHFWYDNLLTDIKILARKTPLVSFAAKTPTPSPAVGYDPFKKPHPVSKEIVVVGEVFELTIVLHNPFLFELEVAELEVSASTSLQTIFKHSQSSFQERATLMNPQSTSEVQVCVIPSDTGDLEIYGIKALVVGCESRIFALPVGKSLHFDVVAPQPSLSLVSTSLDNNCLMLLEGESKMFQITLRNKSRVVINHLVFSSIDSTVEPLNNALLNKKSLPVSEVYEIEYYLLKKNPVKILTKSQSPSIAANETLTIEVEVSGKRGMKDAAIIFEYCNLSSKSYVRRLEVSIGASVYPNIELASCDILPLFSSSDFAEASLQFEEFLASRNLSDFCLLVLDLRNTWRQKINVDFSLSGFNLNRAIPSGETRRILIPVERIFLSKKDLEMPIPSLRNKQFTLDTKTPADEQQFLKTAFWYREELLGRLSGTWSILDGEKSGEIDFRGIRLSSKMVSILEMEKIAIQVNLFDDSGNCLPCLDGTHHVKVHEFYTLQVDILNRTDETIGGMLRNVPISESSNTIDKKVLFNGVLQYPLERVLQPGETRSDRVGVVFLEKGHYQWGYLFDDKSGSFQRCFSEREPFKIRAL